MGTAGIVASVSDDLPASDDLRAGNAEREIVVRRLNDAFGEGRLDLNELDQRIAEAYAAKTMGDLRPLLADLPLPSGRPVPVSRPAAPTPPRPAPLISTDNRAVQHVTGRPGWIRWQYYVWTSIVVLNIVVWALVSIGTASMVYPWPLWVAGPWGIIILAQDVVARLEYARRR